jgi:hypothetical protein
MVVASDEQTAPSGNAASVIEVEMGDVRIRIKGPVDGSVLREVFADGQNADIYVGWRRISRLGTAG